VQRGSFFGCEDGRFFFFDAAFHLTFEGARIRKKQARLAKILVPRRRGMDKSNGPNLTWSNGKLARDCCLAATAFALPDF
jgi:hypothetical protein